MNFKVEVEFHSSGYDLSLINDIMYIDENKYTSIDCHSIKVSVTSLPSYVIDNELLMFITLYIYKEVTIGILTEIIKSAALDIGTYFKDKMKFIRAKNLLGGKNIPIEVKLEAKELNTEVIKLKLDINMESKNVQNVMEELDQITEQLKKCSINETIECKYRNGEWTLTNLNI